MVIENAVGGSNSDYIVGNSVNNKLYGGTGHGVKDILTGGAGADTFICSVKDTTSDLMLADLITDFEVGIDQVGLSGTSINDISWHNEDGDTKIVENTTDQVLFLLAGIDSAFIDAETFVVTDFI